MQRGATAASSLAELAALARIAEIGGHMAGKDVTVEDDYKTAVRAMWALGDYHAFATKTVWGLGPELVAACGISAGQRVLDVAAGSGNVAIRAAEAGASVVASDLTPENFAAGRRAAADRGVEVEWVEADAEALPFPDASFDVVTSAFGAMWAPDHEQVARELLRVCRAGGTIGMVNFTPEGLLSDFLGVLGPYAPPPPPHAQPPTLWGSEEHVRRLFADGVASLELVRKEYVETAASPAEYCELFKTTFGPVVGLFALLTEDPDRAAALDLDLLDFAVRSNRGAPGAAVEYHYEYLLALARKRG